MVSEVKGDEVPAWEVGTFLICIWMSIKSLRLPQILKSPNTSVVYPIRDNQIKEFSNVLACYPQRTNLGHFVWLMKICKPTAWQKKGVFFFVKSIPFSRIYNTQSLEKCNIYLYYVCLKNHHEIFCKQDLKRQETYYFKFKFHGFCSRGFPICNNRLFGYKHLLQIFDIVMTGNIL